MRLVRAPPLSLVPIFQSAQQFLSGEETLTKALQSTRVVPSGRVLVSSKTSLVFANLRDPSRGVSPNDMTLRV